MEIPPTGTRSRSMRTKREKRGHLLANLQDEDVAWKFKITIDSRDSIRP
ncbi:hypothetical protein [Oryzomonas sagensis]|nr:hypothetical protein [Oryzomonas sagensis]